MGNAFQERISLRLLGVCAVAAGSAEMHITMTFDSSSDDVRRINEAVDKLIPPGIDFIVLRDGQHIEEYLANGGQISSDELLTVVPLVLGG